LTGTMAYASGDKNGKPFEALWDAIHDLETAVSLDADIDPTNELSTGYTLFFAAPGNVVTFDASCTNVGDIVVGGGTWTDSTDGIQIRESRPLDIDTWRVAAAYENGSGNAPLLKQVFINCITP